MNKERRTKLAKAVDLLAQAGELVREVIDDEQSALDNLPESLQNSAKGETMQEAIDNLENLDFDDWMNTVQEVIDA